MRYLLEAARPILIDFLSTIVFFALFWTTHNLTLSIVLGIALGVAEVGIRLVRRRPVGAITWMSLGIVSLFGAASLFAQNPIFVMLKPTIAYTLVGAVMLKRGWMRDYAPAVARDVVPPEIFNFWGYAWAGLMFATAALNLALAFTLDVTAWSYALTAWGLVSKLVLFALTYVFMRASVIAHRAAIAAAAKTA